MNRYTLLVLAVSLFSVPFPARADDPAPPKEAYVGGLIGAAISTSSGGSNTFVWSGRLGTGLYADHTGILSLGLAIAGSTNSKTIGTVTASGSGTDLLAEILDRKAFGTGLYYGARIGIGLESLTVQVGNASADSSATAFVVGPVIGYEFAILPTLSIDFDFSWLSTPGVTFTFPSGASISSGSASAFGLLGGLIYHWDI